MACSSHSCDTMGQCRQYRWVCGSCSMVHAPFRCCDMQPNLDVTQLTCVIYTAAMGGSTTSTITTAIEGEITTTITTPSGERVQLANVPNARDLAEACPSVKPGEGQGGSRGAVGHIMGHHDSCTATSPACMQWICSWTSGKPGSCGWDWCAAGQWDCGLALWL